MLTICCCCFRSPDGQNAVSNIVSVMVTTSDFLIVQSCSNPVSISFTSQRAPKLPAAPSSRCWEGKTPCGTCCLNPSCSTWSAFCTRSKKHCRFFSNRISSQEIPLRSNKIWLNFSEISIIPIKFIWQQRTSCLSHAISNASAVQKETWIIK